MRRRDFLKGAAAGATALAGAAVLGRRGARAAGFGEYPEEAAAGALPAELRADSVLEIFLYGGLSAWETLYLVEEYGRPDDPDYPDEQFYTFLGGGGGSVEAALSACSFPDGEPMAQPFATDALGATVNLGPFAYRLR
ncbi:MAG TPA: hypothetical protein VKZ63_18550, partial [Kofleriaceae bacterium]|nr:hypothetical protein [Kofleriaceae bacterium]